ncbi:hypothetical protein [Chitinophaga nivalis]|uniref:DUF5008 domain-containing protein n=1 Tax=Chitinophaga nivalis TaxID=2991709 RepID=A0ABT3IIC8_9BACT|nr:hypothetical protein [Chitinophaga nivalis]MCW3466593.1 hypothetical protein [Chitinophaga nivalis]MCW3483716.1 hypothetical protein [Chitinophaga nivalis]
MLSCEKNQQDQQHSPVSATQIIPANGATLNGVLGVGHTVRDTIHLTGGTYYLNGIVYVDTLDVLQIDAGSVLKGLPGTAATPGGTLVITRGGKIEALGTASAPVVFTSTKSTPAAGDIGGLVILGRATINQPGSPRIEGIGGITPVSVLYGGSFDNDNSGKLRYVRIEYAGFELSVDNELNGLTLGAVGNGTEIDFVEVYKAKDDGIQFFGGTVNVSHVIVVNPLDDALDFEYGYRGRIQYALLLADSTRADRSISNGIESDNNISNVPLLPVTKPLIANLTMIGLPNRPLAIKTNFPPSAIGRYGAAALWRSSSQFEVYNTILLGYENGFLLDNSGGSTIDTQERYRDGFSIIKHNLVHAYNVPFHSANPLYPYNSMRPYPDAPDNNTGYTNPLDPNAAIRLVKPFDRTVPGFYLPKTGNPLVVSPALTGGLTIGLPVGLTGTIYRGAFDGIPGNDWAAAWAVFAY